MDEKELEALKTSNPKAYESYMALKTEKDNRDKADKDAKDKADKEAKDKKDKEEADKNKGDLRDKVKKEEEEKAAKANETKAMEKSIAFNYGVAQFVKDNADALPPKFPAILAQAEKEKYDSQSQKSSAIKKAFVEEFFQVQANVDLLTTAQKAALDEFLKLTVNGRESKASEIYENLFEPALETLKKVKKAEELGKARSGHAVSSKVEDGYKQRLIAGSRKAYLNEKGA